MTAVTIPAQTSQTRKATWKSFPARAAVLACSCRRRQATPPRVVAVVLPLVVVPPARPRVSSASSPYPCRHRHRRTPRRPHSRRPTPAPASKPACDVDWTGPAVPRLLLLLHHPVLLHGSRQASP